MLRFLSALALMLLALPAGAQTLDLAPTAAEELQDMCRDDRGALWGVDLCGPLLVVDPDTRQTWASQGDADGSLRRSGRGWIGTLPEGITIANTSVDWAGIRWIMLAAPLPANAEDRRVLVAHEAWHRIQNLLGMAARPADCAHLADPRARTLLRLEIRALATALRSRGRARAAATEEALIFRAARLAAFPEAAAEEASLDRNEGLAAYTGVKLGAENPEMYAASVLDRYDYRDTYVRTYAYATGPAYGLLLDHVRPTWRDDARAGAVPADLLAALIQPDPPSPSRVQEASDRYGGRQLADQEAARAESQRQETATLRVRYAAGPRLEITLVSPQLAFDPDAITPLEGVGSVYGALTIRDEWGEASATDGALISSDFSRLVLAVPASDGQSGPGWVLRLAEGYQLAGPSPEGVMWIETASPAP
jgi:hypothetical protein